MPWKCGKLRVLRRVRPPTTSSIRLSCSKGLKVWDLFPCFESLWFVQVHVFVHLHSAPNQDINIIMKFWHLGTVPRLVKLTCCYLVRRCFIPSPNMPFVKVDLSGTSKLITRWCSRQGKYVANKSRHHRWLASQSPPHWWESLRKGLVELSSSFLVRIRNSRLTRCFSWIQGSGREIKTEDFQSPGKDDLFFLGVVELLALLDQLFTNSPSFFWRCKRDENCRFRVHKQCPE